MNNGHTRESRHRIAVLEEEDVETFIGFCEFAYRGDYTVPFRPPPGNVGGVPGGAPAVSPFAAANIPPPAPSPPATPRAQEGAQGSSANFEDEANLAGESAIADGGDEAKESGEAGKKGKKAKKDKKPKKGLKIMDEGAGASMTPPRTPPPAADKDESQIQADSQQEEGEYFGSDSSKKPFEPEKTDNQFRSAPPALSPPGVNLWDEFATIHYVQYQRQPAVLPQHMEPQDAYILFHAKIYVFAARFLIPTLAQLALKKLHNDLISFSLDPAGDASRPSNVPLVLEVLHYAYVNTRREDPVFALPSSPHESNAARENQLRKLLAHYAACRVRDLASYQPPLADKRFDPAMLADMVNLHSGLRGLPFSFRDLLDSVKELASDLVFRMM